LFSFDHRFEIHDDVEVLKRMGMAFGLECGKCRQPDVDRALSLVPQCLKLFVMGLSGIVETEVAAAAGKPATLNFEGTTDNASESADQSSRTSPPLESKESPMVIDTNDESLSHSTSAVAVPKADAANSLSECELEADDRLLSDDAEVDNDGSDDDHSEVE
jgi:hypothetical protein